MKKSITLAFTLTLLLSAFIGCQNTELFDSSSTTKLTENGTAEQTVTSLSDSETTDISTIDTTYKEPDDYKSTDSNSITELIET